MKRATLNVDKIDRSAIFTGVKGKYLNLTFFEHKNGRDEYGQDGFIAQDIGKDRRLAGERGPIIGNWSYIEAKAPAQKEMRPEPVNMSIPANRPSAQDDDIPF